MKKIKQLTNNQQDLLSQNYKLVFFVINGLPSKFRFIPYEILYDGGLDGLVFAVRHYIVSKGTFATYARKCIYCRILSAINNYVTKGLVNKVEINDYSLLTENDYEDIVLKKEFRKKLFNEIYSFLNEKQKMFIYLRYEQDFTLSEISEVMGKSLFTINRLKNKTHNIIKKTLKKKLKNVDK